MTKKRVTLIGGAGGPNFGDELILRGWLEYFRSQPGTQFEILTLENIAKNSADLMEPYCGGSHMTVHFSDFLKKVANNVKGLSFWQQVERGFVFGDNSGFKLYKSDWWDFIHSSDVIHLHGGGYLHDWGPGTGFLLGIAAGVAKQSGCKLVATGIGFGPIKDSPHNSKIEEIFNLFEFFELRDIVSFRKLKEMFPRANFLYGLDDCFLLRKDSLAKKSSSSKRRIYLSFLKYNVGRCTDDFWAHLRNLSDSFDELFYWESSPWNDHSVFELIQTKIPGTQLLPIGISVAGLAPLSQKDLFITSRFHVHFVGARSACVGFYQKDTQYYDVKHQSIIDRGSPFVQIKYDDPLEIPQSGINLISHMDANYNDFKISIADIVYKE
jgi:hypothetical protein